MRQGIERAQWGEFVRQFEDDELEDTTGLLQVFEPMLAQIAQTHVLEQFAARRDHGWVGRGMLSAVCCRAKACRKVHVGPHVTCGGELRRTGVQAHAHKYAFARRPGVFGQGALRHHARGNCIGSACKDDEKGIALDIHLAPVEFIEGGAQDFVLGGEG